MAAALTLLTIVSSCTISFAFGKIAHRLPTYRAEGHELAKVPQVELTGRSTSTIGFERAVELVQAGGATLLSTWRGWRRLGISLQRSC